MAAEPSPLRPAPTATMWTSSGSPSPTSGLPGQGKPVLDKGSQRILLVLTPTNLNSADPVNKDSDLQQAQTDYDYLTVNGHEIWISDFIFCADLPLCLAAGLWLLAGLGGCAAPCSASVSAAALLTLGPQHSAASPRSRR